MFESSPFQNIILRTIRVDDFGPDGTFIWPAEPIGKTAYYGEIEYNLKSRQILKPKELKLNYIYGFNENINLVNCLQLTSKIEKSYNKSSDKIRWRFFAGYHFNQDISKQYSFYLSGKNGRTDYLYDNIYLGRNSSNQEYFPKENVFTLINQKVSDRSAILNYFQKRVFDNAQLISILDWQEKNHATFTETVYYSISLNE